MADIDIELNPVDFITVGTVGPKGRRTFHLQAGQGRQTVTLTLEKEQTRALGEAIGELLNDLKERFPADSEGDVNIDTWSMELRDPVDPLFRIAQIGLGYDEMRNMIVIVAQELLFVEEGEDPDLLQPQIVRLWGRRDQFRALSLYAAKIVTKGRADPASNGRLIYYWT
jgi:uncharacterized repeat protein (TIGR03847 family)